MLTLLYLKTLSVEQQKIEIIREVAKCKKDPIYCIETYFSITDAETGQKIPLILYPYQKRAVKEFDEYNYNMSMKSRQMGFTTISSAYTAWFMATKSNMVISALANKLKTSRRFLKSVKDVLDNARRVAPWLIADYVFNDNGKDSFTLKTGSNIKAESNNEDACRGEVINLLIIDEVAAIDRSNPERMVEIWSSVGITLTRSKGTCIAISCVTDDTYVFTDKGIEQIKDFIPSNIDVSKKESYIIDEYNIQGKDKKRSSNIFYVNGYGKTKKIITRYAEVEGSLKHKSWAYSNGEYKWTTFEELGATDWVNIQYGANCWGDNNDISDFVLKKEKQVGLNTEHLGFPLMLTPDWCYLFGLYISEGSVKKDKLKEYCGLVITCGDGIEDIFTKLNLEYQQDGIKYTINSKQLCEFFEYFGFDLSKTAHLKEIPKRLMSISKDNMKALLQGIFDGDGYSTIKNNRVGINLKSEILIEQIRIILGNFGVLSYKGLQLKEDLNSYYNKKGIVHRYDTHTLEINNYFATRFHEEIGFRLERKILTKKQYKKHSTLIPNGQAILRELCKLAGTSIDTLRTKYKIYVHYNQNVGKEQLEKVCSHLERQFPEVLNLARYNEIKDKILIPNSVWIPITNIIDGENYTYDFSLPNDKEDFWAHSVTYNLINQHQTPKGSSGWYYEQYTNAEENGWNIIDAHWSEHPIYSQGMYQYIKDDTKAEGYYIKHYNEEWPKGFDVATRKSYKTQDTYGYVLDGKLRSPWYDMESKKLGLRRTKCELDCSFSGSGGEVIDAEIIRGIILRAKDFPVLNESGKGIWKSFRIYKEYNPDHGYVLSADVSTGDGSDFSAFVIIDLTTKEVVATYKDQVDPIAYAKVIKDVGTLYGNCLVIIEYQGPGLTVLLELKDRLKYSHIYYSSLKKQEVNKTQKRKMGFWQGENTRTLGGDMLEESINNNLLLIPCENIISELYTWIWDKDGKRRHAPGKHDDLVMALANAMYYIYYVITRKENNKEMMRTQFQVNRNGMGFSQGPDSFNLGLLDFNN